jgi:hypothetical protein
MSRANNDFAINLPANWEDQTVYAFMGPYDSGIQHLLTLSVDPNLETSLAEYAQERLDATLETLDNCEVLKEEETTLSSGLPAYEAVLKWIPTDGNAIFRRQVYVQMKGKVYCFAANFSKKTIKTIGVEVSRIIDSLSPAVMEQAESD